MNKNIPLLNTSRLGLGPLSTADAVFIQELVNTEGWIRFIGERNVHSPEEAEAYIQRILDNESIRYWVARLNADSSPVGVITFIQRDYLAFPDIGFAFLPRFSGQGYAFEAANTVLQHLMNAEGLTRILATTLPDNARSIQLLRRLGFSFEQEIVQAGDRLMVFEHSA